MAIQMLLENPMLRGHFVSKAHKNNEKWTTK